nr:MAG: hypothetical protein [Bacteriophage sp.]
MEEMKRAVSTSHRTKVEEMKRRFGYERKGFDYENERI